MFDLWLVETPTGALHIENPLVWLVLSSFILLIIFIFLHSYLHGWFNCYYLLNFVVVWFQKISIPPTRREFEISEGWRGVNENQEIPEGKGGETVELVFRCPSIHSPFRLEVDKTSSSKQPRSKEIKTLVIFRTQFAYMLPESNCKIRMLSNQYIMCFLLFWTVYCECYAKFSTTVQFSFGLALLILKNECYM